MVRPMVHSNKHYVQTSLSSVTGGANASVTIIDAVATPTGVSQVEEGSSVKAVYFEHWVKAGEANNLGTFIAIIAKIPGGASGFNFSQMAALGSADNKKNIFYTTQGLLNTEGLSATNIIKGWVKIPKSKQRFGLGDRLLLAISASSATVDVDHCGFATYKEYT